MPRGKSSNPTLSNSDSVPTLVNEAPRNKRDDFKQPVKMLLAQRVGYLCSNPDCQIPTIGPKMGAPGAQNVGVAAHIEAASIGFARYNASQTPDQRGGFDNGIWLCQTHSKLIDHDEKTFTVELLRRWKKDAEHRAFEQLLSGHGPAKVYRAADQLVDELRDLKARLGLPSEADLELVRLQVAAGSAVQVAAFEATPRWPKHLVRLELAADSADVNVHLTLDRFPTLLAAAQRVLLVAPPGTGKTTTLLQIARAMLAAGSVPAFVPLGEWAESTEDLLGWLVNRHGYEGLSVNHLKFLAHHGELTLLLDGYNEVPSDARIRLMRELAGLERDFPLLNVVTSSRREARSLPLTGPRLVVLPLSDEQQFEIGRVVRGSDGLSIVDAAWRTTGLRDLVTIPLYLRSLLESVHGAALPETKEQVLRGLIETIEMDPVNSENFRRLLLGEQTRFLTNLAVILQRTASSTLSEADARAAVAVVNRTILAQGITATPPSAPQVLDTLVASHTLVRDAGGSFSFQHQQIQEWFASLEFESTLRSATGMLRFDHPLVVERLNDPSWSEVILFACERMARSDEDGVRAVAEMVELMLGIDPLFAAKLIARAGARVWKLVDERVVTFANAWHGKGPDRAAAFMVESRRPEFEAVIWPLVSSIDRQVQMRTIRLVGRFNVAVLGNRLERDYLGLPDDVRENLAGELASHGDRSGMDAAYQLALVDPSIDVRKEVFEGLSFRRAIAQAEGLLRKCGDQLADAVARRGYFDGVHDKGLLDDLKRRQRKLAEAELTPAGKLAQALLTESDEDLPAIIREALQRTDFPLGERGEHVLHDAWKRFPQAVGAALKWRIENKLELPYKPRPYLDDVPPSDDETIVTRVNEGDASGRRIEFAPYLAGPSIVRELVRQYLLAWDKYQGQIVRTEAAYAPVRTLADRLQGSRASVFYDVLQEYAEGLPAGHIHALADVITRHGDGVHGDPLVMPDDQKMAVVKLLKGWGEQLLNQSASRHDMAQLTWAMRRFPDSSLVPVITEMLEADLAARHASRAAFAANRRDEDALQDLRWSHEQEYRVLLTEIGSAEVDAVFVKHLDASDFGLEAAVGLQVLWQQRNEPRPPREALGRWPDFERVAANRMRDRAVTSETAEILFGAVDAALAMETLEGRARAAKIAGCAVLLPHGDRASQLGDLMDSDLPPRQKLDLARRMVVGGLKTSSKAMLATLTATIAEHRGKWVRDNESWQFFQWLELLPASDDPMALLVGIDALSSALEFGTWQLRDVLGGLSLLNEPDRVTLLRGVLNRFPKLANEYEIYLKLKNPGAATLELILDIASGEFGTGAIGRGTRFDFPDELYRELPQPVRDTLAERFETCENGPAKVFLGQMLLAEGDPSTFLRLADTAEGRDIIEHHGWRIFEKLIYMHAPVDGGAGAYERVPRDITQLRKGLFDLVYSGEPGASQFARDYLTRVDASRDEEGFFDRSPRHPDIASGRPWPDVLIATDLVAA